MATVNDEKKALLDELATIAHRVPASINTASVQVVREYKKAVTEANKLLNTSSAPLLKIKGVLSQLKSY